MKQKHHRQVFSRIAFFFAPFLLVQQLLRKLETRQEVNFVPEKELNRTFDDTLVGGVLIPFIRGQGLNNQLWEYRSAAIIARATGRVLCLEPFHRFYLQKRGRKFIPFLELFDVNSLRKFVRVSNNCAMMCEKKVHRHIELVSKPVLNIKHRKPFPIVDWRPGSLKLFLESTHFQFLSATSTAIININSLDQGVKFDSLKDIKEALFNYSTDKCVSIMASTPFLPDEYLLWTRALNVNQNIKNAVFQIKKNVFNDKPYIAIHWRFEETKCAGIGRGIGFGRSFEKVDKNSKQISMRKSDERADLCFFAGPVPNSSKSSIWLRLVSKNAIVNWIKRLKQEKNIENVYIASDCNDPALMQWIKYKTGAKMKADIETILSRFVSLEDNDIVSRIEQQICTTSSIFAGTSMSSWTSSVIEERFKDRNSFFIQDKFHMIRRPDPKNMTFYFDIEVCNCDWDG